MTGHETPPGWSDREFGLCFLETEVLSNRPLGLRTSYLSSGGAISSLFYLSRNRKAPLKSWSMTSSEELDLRIVTLGNLLWVALLPLLLVG